MKELVQSMIKAEETKKASMHASGMKSITAATRHVRLQQEAHARTERSKYNQCPRLVKKNARYCGLQNKWETFE
jgi:hypothetical protein